MYKILTKENFANCVRHASLDYCYRTVNSGNLGRAVANQYAEPAQPA